MSFLTRRQSCISRRRWWTRCNQAPNSSPKASAQTIFSAIAHHSPATSATTCGVKYRPSAAPMIHCPVLRSGVQLSAGPPSIDSTAVASSGPIIHGKGVRRNRHKPAAARAIVSVRTTRDGALECHGRKEEDEVRGMKK
jgi:hypothetical protein